MLDEGFLTWCCKRAFTYHKILLRQISCTLNHWDPSTLHAGELFFPNVLIKRKSLRLTIHLWVKARSASLRKFNKKSVSSKMGHFEQYRSCQDLTNVDFQVSIPGTAWTHFHTSWNSLRHVFQWTCFSLAWLRVLTICKPVQCMYGQDPWLTGRLSHDSKVDVAHSMNSFISVSSK